MLQAIKKNIGHFLRNRPVAIKVYGHKLFVQKWVAKPFADFNERFTIELFKKILKEGDVVFDIGANIGYYSVLASKLVSTNGAVYSFEPDLRNIKLLKRNIEINHLKNVRVIPLLVGNEIKTVKFNLDIDPTESSLFELEKRKDVQYQSIQAKMITIDDFVREYNIKKIDFIKIDVEGAEPLVIEGMKSTILNQENFQMILEFHPEFLTDSHSSPKDFLEMLEKLGFTLFGINDKEKTLFADIKGRLSSNNNKIADEDKINILAIKGMLNN